MKRALRIFIRIVTLPLIAIGMIVGTLLIGLWVLLDWLFETEDNFYPSSKFLSDVMNDFKKYWKGFFK
jgi:hypothetical protein